MKSMEENSTGFNLSKLGRFRIEKTEDYGNSQDHSYEEMIRVVDSKPEKPVYAVPSHLYKYGESRLSLYLKDHKNTWRTLSKLLNQHVDMSDSETFFIFPVSNFTQVSKIVSFARKRGISKPSEAFISAGKQNLVKIHKEKTRQNSQKTAMRTLNSIFNLEVD